MGVVLLVVVNWNLVCACAFVIGDCAFEGMLAQYPPSFGCFRHLLGPCVRAFPALRSPEDAAPSHSTRAQGFGVGAD